MSLYDELLEEAQTIGNVHRLKAHEYIPKMYGALRAENDNISPQDARDRIEKDCLGIWSRRTILDALPDEAKNQEKQKAGRLGQKKHNSAAFSAADQQGKREIVVDGHGRSVEDNPTSIPIDSVTDTKYDSKGNSAVATLQQQRSECPRCPQLSFEVAELREALEKATEISTADKMLVPLPQSSITSRDENEKKGTDILNFEFSFTFRDVRQYMVPLYPKIGDGGKIWFNGKIDKATGKIIAANIGKTEEKRQQGISVEVIS